MSEFWMSAIYFSYRCIRFIFIMIYYKSNNQYKEAGEDIGQMDIWHNTIKEWIEKLRNGDPAGLRIFNAYIGAEEEYQRRYLLNLLLRENTWERLPYLLRLYCENMPVRERNRVHSGICRRSVYVKVKAPLRREILSVPEEHRSILPSWMEEEIVFDLKYL